MPGTRATVETRTERTDTYFGLGATVGEITRRANQVRDRGDAPALRWLRDSHSRIVGVELLAYEAR